MSETKAKQYDPDRIFNEYRKGINYKEALGNNGMYEQNRINQRFYIGDQWHGAQCGDTRPLVRYNIIKRIGDFKMAMAAGSPVAAIYTAEGVECPKGMAEEVKGLRVELHEKGTHAKMNPDQEIHLGMSAMSDYFKVTAERVKFDQLKNHVLRQAYVTGSGVLYTYWDESIRTGRFADEAHKEPIRGDIRCEVLDIENVYFGDTAEPDVQNQPYIIIAKRMRVEDVKREARRARRPQTDIDAIKADSETDHMAGDLNEREPSGEEKVTVLTKLYKVYDEDTDEYTIHAVRVVKGATIRPEWDTTLRRYPLAKMDWELEPNCAYGTSEVTALVPNQIAINRAQTASAHAVMMAGMPIMLVNMDVISTPITNDPGQVVPVYGSEHLDHAIHYEVPPNFSAQFDNLVNSMMSNTASTSGANDAALGNMRPDNTSAILALREAATVPLELLKSRFYSFVEDVARNWAEFWVCMYGTRPLKVEDDYGVWYMPFDAKKYHDLLINVRVDVGPANLWSEIQQLMTLDKLLEIGAIDQQEYMRNLPKGSIPNQEAILQRLQEKAAPANPPTEPEGDDPMQLTAKLDDEHKEKLAAMTPEQRQMLAEVMGGM